MGDYNIAIEEKLGSIGGAVNDNTDRTPHPPIRHRMREALAGYAPHAICYNDSSTYDLHYIAWTSGVA